MPELSSEDRAFFAQVSRAAFSNPFGAARDELDRKIAALRGKRAAGDIIEEATRRVGERLELLDARSSGARTDAHWQADDQRLVEHAILFHTFHEFADDLDAFIEEELHSSAPPEVRFADRLMKRLQHRGLSRDRSKRMLELFYQMRRAHRFISRALVGSSAAMRQVREALWDNVFTQDVERYERHLWDRMEDFSTILIGPTGTGKTSAASAIARSGYVSFNPKTKRFSERVDDLFVAVNLSEFAESLIESELFGHKKGAFTGATQDYDGWLSRCSSHGSIFIDEIGDTNASVQLKLLRVLQERNYTAVGGQVARRFSGRVIAATHQPLEQLRANGTFRDDFYYRLSSDVIELPSLRSQLDDDDGLLDELVAHVLSELVGDSASELRDDVLASLRRDVPANYAWPGNVRELEQFVRRVLVRGRCSAPKNSQELAESDLARAFEGGELSADALLSRYCGHLHQQLGSYTEVAARTALDPRTVKKYVLQYQQRLVG